jgi:hypothetical protein
MKQAPTRLGPWRIERTLGRDLSGGYHAGCRSDGQRATLYVPSSEVAARGGSLPRLLALHRDVAHRGVVCFRDLDHDGDDLYLIADAVDDAMVSLRRGRRPLPGQTRAVGAALAAALVAAHDADLIHGGLELDNVLWAPDQLPRILGAGVASLGSGDCCAPAHGDVVGLGRLLCALVASWSPAPKHRRARGPRARRRSCGRGRRQDRAPPPSPRSSRASFRFFSFPFSEIQINSSRSLRSSDGL